MRFEIDSENWIEITISSETSWVESSVFGHRSRKDFKSFHDAKKHFEDQGEYLVELNRFLQLCQVVGDDNDFTI